ncbi:MAG TPA: MFS transporter, partial [Vicinamibacteria bacterium]|nr:MFS transporter [Vicinamibacteria bacterium]
MNEIGRDVGLLFLTRAIRLFAYGSLAVVLVLYLAELGMSEARIGALLSLTLLGDTAISLWITTRADELGRRRMLMFGAGLMILAGAVFAASRDPTVLLAAAIIGVISPGGNEVGPFLSIEQAALAHVVGDGDRTRVFAWYQLTGSFAMATGSLAGGGIAGLLQSLGAAPLESYRAVVMLYAASGTLLLWLFHRLGRAVEVRNAGVARRRFGLVRSHRIVASLSALFALDSFAGGFVVQSLVAYWFHVRHGVAAGSLGAIFFGANLLAGLSSLVAARIAARIGLLRTMVFTHLPSNVLLILVPLMPTASAAIAVLLVRFCISQMDVPTRQSYTMGVVLPEERSAAAGITGVARTTGAALSPMLAAPLLGTPWLNLPFFLAGGLKILYDLLL